MSQPDVVTLAVDELNNGTTVNHVMTNYDRSTVRSTYIGAGHSVLARDMMTLFRSPSKPNGNFAGVEKTSAKLTWDRTVTGVDGLSQLKAPAICAMEFSLPVGMSEADKLFFRQKACAVLDHNIMIAFQQQLVI